MAAMCFGKAGEEKLEKMSKASGLRAAADNVRGSNSEEAAIMLREAAEIFDSIDRAELAAECFYYLRDFERAGILWINHYSPLEVISFAFLQIKKQKGSCLNY